MYIKTRNYTIVKNSKMENEIILFECCVGFCEPKCKGNINDIYYICAECFDKDLEKDLEQCQKR
jgi:hypothetical protein